MKFTKQQAYENIVAKLTKNGEKLDLSERSINEQLDTLIKAGANEETELEDFVKSFLPLFVTANANVRNDVSAGINKYKEEHPETNVKKNGIETGEKKKPTDTESVLEQRLAELESRLAKQDKETKIADVKNKLKASLKEKGVKNEDWISSILNEISIDEDSDISSKTDSLLGLYNKFVASVDPSLVPLGNPGGQGSGKSLEDKMKAVTEYAKGNLAN